MDYEKKYKETLERAKKEWSDNLDGAYKNYRERLEFIFPELESEDEKVRKEIIALVKFQKEQQCHRDGAIYDRMIAWLEKQCQVKESTIFKHEIEMCKENNDSLTNENERIRKAIIETIHLYYGEPLEDEAEEMISWLEKQGQTFTKKDVDDAYLKGVCDTKQELEKQGEQKPFDYEHANIPQKDFAPKSAMEAIKKEKPKFDIGAWVVWQNQCYKVNYNGCGYELIDQNGLSTSLEYGTVDNSAHLWTIEDAKDGDVLYLQKDGKEHIIIYKGVIKERFRTFVSAYCAYNGIVDAFCFADVSRYTDIAYGGIMPATKEQRDTLFAEMKEAGYEWDAEKKELKKIEDKPLVIDEGKAEMDYCFTKMMNGEKVSSTLSEEDEAKLKSACALIRNTSLNGNEDIVDSTIDWLKSLKQRIGE